MDIVAFLIDFDGTLLLRGDRSYLFDFILPDTVDLDRAASGELVLIKDWPNSEFRALLPIVGYPDRLLYVARAVDGRLRTGACALCRCRIPALSAFCGLLSRSQQCVPDPRAAGGCRQPGAQSACLVDARTGDWIVPLQA